MNSNSAKYQSRNPLKRFLLNRFLHKISFIISRLRFDSLLDAGCGEGYVLAYLAYKNLIKSEKTIGVDIAENKLRKEGRHSPKVLFRKMSVFDLKFPDRKFDIILALELLEHLKQPNIAVKELWRVTNKTLILSVPNEPMFTALRFLSGHNFWNAGKLNEHVNHWNEGKFKLFLKNTVDQNVIIYKSAPWLIAVLNKI